MYIRVIDISQYSNDQYKILSVLNVDEYDVFVKTVEYMKKNKIVFEINTTDIADTDGDTYYVKDVSLVIPKISGELLPYIAVYVSEDAKD